MSNEFEGPFVPRLGTSRWRGVLLVGLVVAAVATAWRLTRPAPVGAPMTSGHGDTGGLGMPIDLSLRDQERIGVTFAAVELAPLNRDVRTVAQVTFDETRVRAISPLIDGWIDQLFVNFTGQAVQRDQALFTIYAPMVVAAQQELILALQLGTDVRGGTPEAVRGAQDLIHAARRRLEYWGVATDEVRAIEAAGTVRRTVTLRSPYPGVIIDKFVAAGQRIMAGDVAYRIADLSRVWLEGEVFEQDLPAVRLGLAVHAEFTGLPGEVRTGTLTYIYPTVNPETRTARIRVELQNPGLALKPGMYGTIRFTAPSPSVLSIPRSAVLSTGERNLVFLRKGDGQFVPRLVSLGRTTHDRVEIVSGVSVGDTVVTSATFLVDAESNLGALLGGMGNMPGMDMTAPTSTTPPTVGGDSGTRKSTVPSSMPGMPDMRH